MNLMASKYMYSVEYLSMHSWLFTALGGISLLPISCAEPKRKGSIW